MTHATSRSIGLGKYTIACKISHIFKGCEKAAVVELFAWVVCPRDGVSVGLITPATYASQRTRGKSPYHNAGWSISLTSQESRHGYRLTHFIQLGQDGRCCEPQCGGGADPKCRYSCSFDCLWFYGCCHLYPDYQQWRFSVPCRLWCIAWW